jgi:hypothetical protein
MGVEIHPCSSGVGEKAGEFLFIRTTTPVLFKRFVSLITQYNSIFYRLFGRIASRIVTARGKTHGAKSQLTVQTA